MYPKLILSHPTFFGERTRCSFGKVVVILSVAPTFPCFAEQESIALQIPKINLRSSMGQDRQLSATIMY